MSDSLNIALRATSCVSPESCNHEITRKRHEQATRRLSARFVFFRVISWLVFSVR